MNLEYISNNIELLKGQSFWVCCYSHQDFTKKAERNVKPTQVVWTQDPRTWNYLCKFKLRVVSKKERLTTREIVPRANYSRAEVEFYETELGAKKAYIRMLNETKVNMEKYILNLNEGLNKQIEDIQKEIDLVI